MTDSQYLSGEKMTFSHIFVSMHKFALSEIVTNGHFIGLTGRKL